MKVNLGNFGKQPGSSTKNNLRAGQNLPTIGGELNPLPIRMNLFSVGPEVIGLQYKTRQGSGPLVENVGFQGGAHQTISELYLFWALHKLLGPTWEGKWQYQGHASANSQVRGFANVDFIIFLPHYDVGIRVQTYRFHQNVDPTKQAYDVEQYLALHNRYFRVIDVFEDDYIDDPTGQAAIQLMLEVINGRERPNPLATGYVVGTG